jgi:hypothetical protein
LCPVQAVTTVPPPASALGPPVTNTLYLRTWCLVNAGDVMLVIYHQTASGVSRMQASALGAHC